MTCTTPQHASIGAPPAGGIGKPLPKDTVYAHLLRIDTLVRSAEVLVYQSSAMGELGDSCTLAHSILEMATAELDALASRVSD